MSPLAASLETPGTMTRVMRAAPPIDRSKVLRVALVRAGKVVDEGVLPHGAALTVGPSEQSTLVVHAPNLPPCSTLFEVATGGYRLHPVPGLAGRVATGAGVVKVNDRMSMLLGDNARGLLTLGHTTLLFQLVDPPARSPRPQLPLAAQQGVFGELDWKTTCIAAFSFLVHFGGVGAIYSDWADGVVDDAVRIAQVVEHVRNIPYLPPVDVRTEDFRAEALATSAPTSTPPATAPHGWPSGGTGSHGAPHEDGKGRGGPPNPSARMVSRRAAEIAQELQAMNETMRMALGGLPKGATERLLGVSEEMPTSMLDAFAEGPGALRPRGVPGLHVQQGGSTRLPGTFTHRTLPAECASCKQADTPMNEVGKPADVKKPLPGTTVKGPQVLGGELPDADRVVAGLRGSLRACYKHALDEDPTMRGSVHVTASIAPNGEVRSVQASSGTLSLSMVACVKRVVSGAQFKPPKAGGAMLAVPMSFLPQ